MNNIQSKISCTIIVLLILQSCATIKNTNDKNWSLEFIKGGCLEVCESYEIDILNDGTYHYKGIYNAPLGTKSGELSENELSELQTVVDSIDWNSMENQYGSPAEDSQQKELTYTTSTLTKRILIYRLEPFELRRLEQLLDQIILDDEF